MAGCDAHEYQDALVDGPIRGRGASLNPGNRFEPIRLHESDFGVRMRGRGTAAETINQIFRVFSTRYGLDGRAKKIQPLSRVYFHRPPLDGQLNLFVPE